jgi:hypothetical protein
VQERRQRQLLVLISRTPLITQLVSESSWPNAAAVPQPCVVGQLGNRIKVPLGGVAWF